MFGLDHCPCPDGRSNHSIRVPALTMDMAHFLSPCPGYAGVCFWVSEEDFS